jgi:hypothetical protein
MRGALRRPASGIVTYAVRGITSPEWAETLVVRDDRNGRLAERLRAQRPKGTRQEISTDGRENFPRLKPRLNGNFSLGSSRADLEIDCVTGG